MHKQSPEVKGFQIITFPFQTHEYTSDKSFIFKFPCQISFDLKSGKLRLNSNQIIGKLSQFKSNQILEIKLNSNQIKSNHGVLVVNSNRIKSNPNKKINDSNQIKSI